MKTIKKTIGGDVIQIKFKPPAFGDILVFPHDGRFVIGVVDSHHPGRGTMAVWDDFSVLVPMNTGYFATPSQLRKSAGTLIGLRFETLDEAYIALRAHRP